MENTSKARTPSRCREWERQRRNKFNDAITKLGEAVKAINKVNNPSEKDSDNVQYPKIEIVQKAITCLTNCAQEKTQLKAEILALQVKIEASKPSPESKDASTQVHTSFSKKMQNGKYVKLLMLQKSKRKALKEKQILTTNVTVEGKSKRDKSKINQVPPTPPKILPKSSLNDKKRTENTIVVLPAAPYLFPQRPLFLPAVPPAFVIVDPNIQTLSKPSVPIVNRTNGDTTKTTMVNILPISAYSRPLSATKTKKMNSKSKNDTTKKVKKKSIMSKSVKEAVKKQLNNATDSTHSTNSENPPIEEKQTEVLESDTEVKCAKDPTIKIKPATVDNNISQNQKKKEDERNVINNKLTVSTSKGETSSTSITIKTVEKVNLNENQKVVVQPVQTNRIEILKEVNMSLKSTSVEDKDKENKLPNILDTALCESGVDGGNARLELAEEFLAASPTAAFLMSFPLVSGNRADSPAEEASNSVHTNVKDNSTHITIPPASNDIYFEKPPTNNDVKTKAAHKQPTSTALPEKQPSQMKYLDNNIISKSAVAKTSTSVPSSNPSSENPFLNLPMPSLITTTTQSDTFGMDFDCNINKSIPSQSSAYVSNSNLFYKGDPFNAVKSTIYSTSSIASGHEFNSLGLYPCAMEKYSKNKSDFTNVEDNLMKIGSSRLTYDIDLGWSHKGFDFVNCTTNSNTFSKDILTTATAPTYSSSYNPFNPEFHVPLVSAPSKKDSSSKSIASFAETITSLYSTPQPTNLWSEEMCFYNNSASKSLTNKHQNYLHLEHAQTNTSIKPAVTKQYETKTIPDSSLQNIVKPSSEVIRQQLPDKYNKKSPNKMHINWMTSELRPMQNNCNPPQTDIKEPHKQPYGQVEHSSTKKQDQHEGNYFPIAIHNFSAQPAQEDFQVWPSTRPLGTTEISIEPPPINLPTLVGDLALGPHDKKKNADLSNRIGVQPDIQNCGNFLSVTQLMNRSSDNATSRYHGSTTETPKAVAIKQSNAQFSNDANRKAMSTRVELNLPQPCYVFNDPKHSYENMGQFSQVKPKTNKPDKNAKVHKHSYSAEALIRSGNCTQKIQDHIGPKYMAPTQKYGDFNASQDTSVAQVSHFPPILDYSDNSYTGQQFSGTTLYNSTTNTISNSFYTNFMTSNANIMTGSYTSTPFTGDFMDYNQAECNYTNNKYEEFKMRGNPVFQDKVPSNYKSSRREPGTKHKLECTKKDSKKYQNKRVKVSETEEWSDANLFWQNKGQIKKGPNMLSEELTFANYVGNSMAPQYQHELFNSHLVNAPADRSLATFPATSRANFNLSTIFPEITMKVQ